MMRQNIPRHRRDVRFFSPTGTMLEQQQPQSPPRRAPLERTHRFQAPAENHSAFKK